MGFLGLGKPVNRGIPNAVELALVLPEILLTFLGLTSFRLINLVGIKKAI